MKPSIFAIILTLLICIYGGMHVYAYFKLKKLIPGYRWLLISVLVIMAVSVFIIEVLIHNNIALPLATPLAFISFSWMGIMFLFFSLSVSIDIISWLSAKFAIDILYKQLALPARTLIVAISSLLLGIYGYLASQQINIEKQVMYSDRIKTPMKIVQISDLHLGLMSNEDYFKKVVNTINAINPDIIVATGDIVDMKMDHLDSLSTIISQLNARDRKFAILGNHEALAGLAQSRRFFNNLGFRLLSNSGITLGNHLNLIGVDDPAVARHSQQPAVDEQALLQKFNNGLYTILLKHQPTVSPGSPGLFDLQLSGHTHGGQIFPFGLLIHLFYKAPFGLSQQGEHSWLYVSRGTGTWGPPMRIMASPEITLVQLQPTEQAQ